MKGSAPRTCATSAGSWPKAVPEGSATPPAYPETGSRARLRVEYRSLESLIPFAGNPREHSDEQVAQIAESIREFGFTNPVLLDGVNGVIADIKLALNGAWNEDLLRLALTELKELGANLELTGFDPMELAAIMLGKDVSFREYDESAADDVEPVTWPKCGHSFPR